MPSEFHRDEEHLYICDSNNFFYFPVGSTKSITPSEFTETGLNTIRNERIIVPHEHVYLDNREYNDDYLQTAHMLHQDSNFILNYTLSRDTLSQRLNLKSNMNMLTIKNTDHLPPKQEQAYDELSQITEHQIMVTKTKSDIPESFSLQNSLILQPLIQFKGLKNIPLIDLSKNTSTSIKFIQNNIHDTDFYNCHTIVNYKELLSDLNNESWDNVINCQDPDVSLDCFYKTLK